MVQGRVDVQQHQQSKLKSHFLPMFCIRYRIRGGRWGPQGYSCLLLLALRQVFLCYPQCSQNSGRHSLVRKYLFVHVQVSSPEIMPSSHQTTQDCRRIGVARDDKAHSARLRPTESALRPTASCCKHSTCLARGTHPIQPISSSPHHQFAH